MHPLSSLLERAKRFAAMTEALNRAPMPLVTRRALRGEAARTAGKRKHRRLLDQTGGGGPLDAYVVPPRATHP